MSSFQKHLIAGIIVFGIITYFLFNNNIQQNMNLIGLGFIVGVAFSVLPDVDIGNSIPNRIVERLFLIGIGAAFVYNYFYPNLWVVLGGLAGVIVLFYITQLRHRDIAHSLKAGILLSIPLYFINPYLVVYSLGGFITHIALDKYS